ncbi:MAG TPA: tRNA (adenosine(37)-N6)-threonylcarbamoyltransferase complex ATPase subunit type 1 TsaE [Jatrophihabitans sp.]|jgi:tRNA threonylcarbamoyladenosine biosynthesis protein TsaE|nr:tRNA (adenosine(37)-N6)-threonylcarbamoyltransferase complex ATPase subunit type 1 TsaE [Jatrophihabitans sp.]
MTLGPLRGPGRPAGPIAHGALDGHVVRLPTAADTCALGARLGELLRAGDLVVLSGALGAGKTTLVQGIGAGMGVTGRIASPTFVLARVHPAQLPGGPALIHVDAYRLGSLAEVDDLDLDVELDDSVVVVEWGTGLVEQLAEAWLSIGLARADDTEERTATCSPHGSDWATRLASVVSASGPR